MATAVRARPSVNIIYFRTIYCSVALAGEPTFAHAHISEIKKYFRLIFFLAGWHCCNYRGGCFSHVIAYSWNTAHDGAVARLGGRRYSALHYMRDGLSNKLC